MSIFKLNVQGVLAGLTGGIACGKTHIRRCFEELGCGAIDADQLARKAVEPGSDGLAEILDRFGTGVLTEDGALDRRALGRLAFSDSRALSDLNAIVHPRVRKAATEAIRAFFRKNPNGIYIYEIPLLFEVGLEKEFSCVIVAYAANPVQLSRLIGQGFTEEEALNRITAQIPIDEKASRANFVIDTSAPKEETRETVRIIYGRIRAEPR